MELKGSGKVIIANWKMNLAVHESVQVIRRLRKLLDTRQVPDSIELVVCPSYDALTAVREELSGSKIRLGGQDVFWQEKGAYTGEVSASMLVAAGVSHVLIGHSERRKYLQETDEMVNKKVTVALAAGLIPIICVGETYEERSIGHTDLVLMRQTIEGLKGIPLHTGQEIIVAYEPVWVIGTGQAIEPPMAEHASEVITQSLIDLYSKGIVESQTRIIYGGSVDETNIRDFLNLQKISGALVGTASLQPEKFISLLALL